ncbi:MAG: FkbM family methyltransferase, partial [Firmicutes bacterium]|nr:FkbM family methyltransferase [Bacillota bacterium]
KYLHRDGDIQMSLWKLIKRELSESREEKALAKKKFSKKTYREFSPWISYYHRGMFFKPTLSKEVAKVHIYEKNNLKINFRKNQSDIYILRENFVSEIYDFDFEKYVVDAKVIMDLGANIGLSSLYFQSRFKNAKIYCVEPVKQNIDILFKNSEDNNFNWEIIRGAIQEKNGFVTLYPNEWWSSSTVTNSVANHRENKKGRLEKIYKLPTEKVDSYSIDYLMEKYNLDQIDILKMDIEGAEESVVMYGDNWLKKVKILIIEIHDKYVNRKIITKKLLDFGFVQQIGRNGPTDVFCQI